MVTPLDDVCLASLPAAALPALAPLRCHPDVEAWREGERLWLHWPTGSGDVLRWLLPVAGLELYTCREGLWYRPGRLLPAFDVVLTNETVPLHRLLTPAPCQPEAPRPLTPDPSPPEGRGEKEGVPLRLAREDTPRVTTALRCEVAHLGKWTERATSAELATLRGARAGNRALLLGRRLPPLPGERFWGERVLLPLGHRAEPDLPESALRQVLGLAEGEIAVLGLAFGHSPYAGCREGEAPAEPAAPARGHAGSAGASPSQELDRGRTLEGVDVVSAGALRPLTRAGVRLAQGGERAWTP
jgi:hypothetical protein